jgi:hypothetical protein
MGFPTSEVGYTSATTGRRDHEVHMGHVVALGGEELVVVIGRPFSLLSFTDQFMKMQRKSSTLEHPTCFVYICHSHLRGKGLFTSILTPKIKEANSSQEL